jgi:hypothetical protein
MCLLLMSVVFDLHAGDVDQHEEVVQELPVPMILLEENLFDGGLNNSALTQVERIAIPPPHAPAKPGAFILRWDKYRTLIVIDDSAGLVKSCWIVTLAAEPEEVQTRHGIVSLARGQVVVAYRGQVYYDKTGTLQINAQGAKLTGRLWEIWSPDSFSISAEQQVLTRDDDPSHPPNMGEIEKEISADQKPAEYKKLSLTAQAIIGGNI